MKIALEALVHEGDPIGAGRYARLLLEGLAEFGSEFDYYLFDYLSRNYGDRIRSLWLPQQPNVEVRFRWFPKPAMKLLEERLGFRIQDRWLRRAHVDLFHGLRGILPPMKSTIRKLLTVHDVQFKINPEWFQDVWWSRFDRSVAETDHIITGSTNTARELGLHCGVPADKITVIPYGLSPQFRMIDDARLLHCTRTKYRLPEEAVLFVGGLRPLKNLMRLVEAFAGIASQFTGAALVLVGKSVAGHEPLMELIQSRRLTERVIFTGYVSEDELIHLYNMATVFAFPSLHEGFGYPVLEAMACGTPVLASNITSLPEVCGDAAEFVDPLNTESIAEGLRRLLSSPERRRELIAKGSERCRHFAWRTCIERHLAVYRKLLNS